jgi:hypothetical protein
MVLHTTPFAVMSRPPLEIIFPPVVTVYDVMDETSAVDKIGVDVLLSSLAHPIKNKMAQVLKIFCMLFIFCQLF